LLEDAGIKLSAVASDIMGVSGRAMLEALIAGDRDPAGLADLAKRRLRSKIEALTEALTGRFTDHHAFLARIHLDLIDRHTRAIGEVTDRIEVVIEPFRAFRELICTIPGIGQGVADVICAETGADMTRFPPWTDEGDRCHRARDPDRDLEPGRHRRALRGPRTRLLHPAEPRPGQTPRPHSAPNHGLQRHAHPLHAAAG